MTLAIIVTMVIMKRHNTTNMFVIIMITMTMTIFDHKNHDYDDNDIA